MKFKVNDIIFNTKSQLRLPFVLVRFIDEKLTGYRYCVLAPFTKVGFPSINQSIYLYKKESDLEGYELWDKKGADNQLKFCPECKDEEDSLFYNPLRKRTVYHDEWQCKSCKKWYGKGQVLNG